MMVEYLRAANITPSVALATALYYGIKVDTQNFEKKNMQLADGISFRYVFNIANRNLFLPEIFEHKQLLYSICQAFSFILLQKTKATRFRVVIVPIHSFNATSDTQPFKLALKMTPLPTGLVSISESPGRAPVLVQYL